ncbi:class I SAM-dependent methyltransferase [Moorena producens JHB]|uniref:Class I SAM-dependent methyltransferase n=1 Tax=Moorena producens (strain JHB) TaxID=1454205 RepID=A0A1D9G3Y3_MOOP1|nr:class I SAM-dependent methyltransferase [Moorena producens]AOY82110.1 class I SAM-dependent methyltransferase [Moorena producens JHB]
MTNDVLSRKERIFDLWAPQYDFLLTTVFYQALHKRLLEYLELSNQPNVLDLGCGTGRLLNRLAKEFPTLTGIGLDLSTEMLRQARQQNQYRERVIYKKGNAESLPFAEGQFELVLNCISFLHYQNPQQVFLEVNRVLSSQGRFYLIDNTANEDVASLPLSPDIRLYSPKKREEFGKIAGLSCLGHHYLLGTFLLSIFGKLS